MALNAVDRPPILGPSHLPRVGHASMIEVTTVLLLTCEMLPLATADLELRVEWVGPMGRAVSTVPLTDVPHTRDEEIASIGVDGHQVSEGVDGVGWWGGGG